jgi:CRP/FNR family cyclic AMP-dependent transcriptional regulator
MESLARVLRDHEFLQGLSSEEADVLVGCVRNARWKPGELLLREGQPADTFHLIREGRVVLESHVPGRGATQLESLAAGDMLGLSWLFPPHRHQLDARALDPVVTLAFDASCLRARMDADHDLGFALTRRLLAEALRRLERVRLQRLDVYRPR